MKIAVVVFPGSNCDHDVAHAYARLLGQDVSLVWHREPGIGQADIVVIPGGFSFGDYLRTGALAKLSPIMSDVVRFADAGGKVIGICNGFQVLCECGLLPGVLLRNVGLQFLSQFVHLRVERSDTPFTASLAVGRVLCCPVAHGDGNYFADPEIIERLEGEGQIVFRYSDAQGRVDPEDRVSNPNGSVAAIAGICNSRRNVVGLMPHPERIAENGVGFLGGDEGLAVFRSSIDLPR